MNKQREIKFKTWDKESKEMSEFFDLAHADCYVNPFSEDPIMQYTGLHDKNGKEIYEGDIVRWKRNQKNKVNEIIVKIIVGEIIYEIDYIAAKSKNMIYRIPPRCEVIGNIYENKNLLK